MTLLVYAFTEAAPAALEECGLDGRPLRIVADGALGAIVGELDGAEPELSAANLWDYEQAMERLMAARAILPARFATVLGDDEQVRALLRERRDELAAGLERVRGAVELGARARWRARPAPTTLTAPASEAAEGGPGTAYLIGRVAASSPRPRPRAPARSARRPGAGGDAAAGRRR